MLGLSAPNPDTRNFSRKVSWNFKSFAKMKWCVLCEVLLPTFLRKKSRSGKVLWKLKSFAKIKRCSWDESSLAYLSFKKGKLFFDKGCFCNVFVSGIYAICRDLIRSEEEFFLDFKSGHCERCCSFLICRIE